MKSFMFFVLGCLTGFVFTIFLFYTLTPIGNKSTTPPTIENEPAPLYGATMLPDSIKGDCVGAYKFEIFQVIEKGHALANKVEKNDWGRDVTSSLVVLLLKDDSKAYYDEQVISIPKGKCARQIGTFRYTNRMDTEKTVPIVKIMDK